MNLLIFASILRRDSGLNNEMIKKECEKFLSEQITFFHLNCLIFTKNNKDKLGLPLIIPNIVTLKDLCVII